VKKDCEKLMGKNGGQGPNRREKAGKAETHNVSRGKKGINTRASRRRIQKTLWHGARPRGKKGKVNTSNAEKDAGRKTKRVNRRALGGRGNFLTGVKKG